MLERLVPVLDSVRPLTLLIWLGCPEERAGSSMLFMNPSSSWHSHVRHAAALPWLSVQGRSCWTAVTRRVRPTSPLGEGDRSPGTRTSARSAEAAPFHLALAMSEACLCHRLPHGSSSSGGNPILCLSPCSAWKRLDLLTLKAHCKPHFSS